MPPRFAYWTILIDQKPTAFRAAEKEDLLPTLVQLQRKNADVVLKWFARGKLWDTPEQATWARTNLDRPGEKRNRDWRPGGKHEDPRMRFKKGGRRDSPRAAFAKKAAFDARSGDKPSTDAKPENKRAYAKAPADRRDGDAPRPLPSAPKPKWTGERKPYTGARPKWTGERRGPSTSEWTGERKPPPAGDRRPPSGDRRPPSGDRPKWSGDRRPAPAAKRSDSDAPRPLPSKPLPKSARPKWSGDRKPSSDGPRSDRHPPPRGDRPSFGKPSTYAKAPADKREGRPFKKPDRNRR